MENVTYMCTGRHLMLMSQRCQNKTVFITQDDQNPTAEVDLIDYHTLLLFTHMGVSLYLSIYLARIINNKRTKHVIRVSFNHHLTTTAYSYSSGSRDDPITI